MPSNVIVLLADEADPSRGHVSVVGSTADAERLIEGLLDAGHERERIRVFSGAELDARVSQRLVVALVAPGYGRDPRGGDGNGNGAAQAVSTAAAPAPPWLKPATSRLVEMMPELFH